MHGTHLIYKPSTGPLAGMQAPKGLRSIAAAHTDKRRIAMRKNSFSIVCFCVLLWTSMASAAVNLRDVVTFGDSLTDNDLLTFYSGSPQEMYGRDPMHAVFYKA